MKFIFSNTLSEAVTKHIDLLAIRRETQSWLALLIMQHGTISQATPRRDDGRLKHHLFRRLTENTGHLKLWQHLASVVTIMKLSSSYDDFMEKIDGIHPRYGETMRLALPEPDEQDTRKGI
jgi:hypothetical protein